jgi:hypothetical protein
VSFALSARANRGAMTAAAARPNVIVRRRISTIEQVPAGRLL